MEEIKLVLNEKNHGGFLMLEDGEEIGEMAIAINGNDLTVYHTEIAAQAEGQGYAKKMLHAMVEYARAKRLKVIALCPFVHAQFQRRPEEYADIWKSENK